MFTWCFVTNNEHDNKTLFYYWDFNWDLTGSINDLFLFSPIRTDPDLGFEVRPKLVERLDAVRTKKSRSGEVQSQQHHIDGDLLQ